MPSWSADRVKLVRHNFTMTVQTSQYFDSINSAWAFRSNAFTLYGSSRRHWSQSVMVNSKFFILKSLTEVWLSNFWKSFSYSMCYVLTRYCAIIKGSNCWQYLYAVRVFFDCVIKISGFVKFVSFNSMSEDVTLLTKTIHSNYDEQLPTC